MKNLLLELRVYHISTVSTSQVYTDIRIAMAYLAEVLAFIPPKVLSRHQRTFPTFGTKIYTSA